MLQTIRKDMEQTKAIIADLTCRIKEVLSPYENVMELLQKIPGLSRKTVEDLIAEIGVDMEAFPTEKHLASESVSVLAITRAQVKKSGRTTHGNKQLKAVITEAAWAATRTKNTFTVHVITV